MFETPLRVRGEIPLHDRHAIGLQLESGGIGLHPFGNEGNMIGIRLNVSMWHWREGEHGSNAMNLEFLEMAIPAPAGNYVGRIEGWEHYKTIYPKYYYKPKKCQLVPGYTEFTTFAWMDSFDGEDPWFYFGWGLRTEKLPTGGYRNWTHVAHMGVNYPIEDDVRPSWVEAPGEEEMLSLMKPHAPPGDWTVKARISGFTVDPDVTRETKITFRVWQGQRPFYRGVLDFVKGGGRIVGEDDADLSGINWGSPSEPGELRILSGQAEGCVFRVVRSFNSGNQPPPGIPPNIWCIQVSGGDPPPSSLGVKAGDRYMVVGRFHPQVAKLMEFHEEYPPGTYEPMDLEFSFRPIL